VGRRRRRQRRWRALVDAVPEGCQQKSTKGIWHPTKNTISDAYNGIIKHHLQARATLEVQAT